MELLITKGSKINIVDHKQRTPLHLAAWSGNLYAVRALLENGAEINPRMINNKTPLTLAQERERSDVIYFLLQKGAVE